MGLLDIRRIEVGQVGIKPGTLKMLTTDGLSTITTAGYLNGVGNQLTSLNIAPSDVIECMYSYNAITDSGTFTLLSVSITNGVITLAAGAGSEPLISAHIFVGNASNVATDVAMTGDIGISNAGVTAIQSGVIVNADINASAAIAFSKLAALASGNILVGSAGTVPTSVAMSGDATIIASGALTIAANAITTAKILNANVTLGKLAAGITPSDIVKFAGKGANGGGSPTVAISVTGVLTSDKVFAQIEASANAVTVQKVTPTADTITVLLSGDPGAGTIITYQALRAAS